MNTRDLVVHCKKQSFDCYIGRANHRGGLAESKWANPFVIGKDGDRAEVIAKYKAWFFTQPTLVNSVHELKSKTLGCWCSPLDCHGHFLAEIANREGGNQL